MPALKQITISVLHMVNALQILQINKFSTYCFTDTIKRRNCLNNKKHMRLASSKQKFFKIFAATAMTIEREHRGTADQVQVPQYLATQKGKSVCCNDVADRN